MPADPSAALGGPDAAADPSAALGDQHAAADSDDENGREDANKDEAYKRKQKVYAETAISDDERRDFPSIFSEEVDEIIDILKREGKREQYQKLQRDLRNCRDCWINIQFAEEDCNIAKRIMDENKIFDKNKVYKDEITSDKIRLIRRQQPGETDDYYADQIAGYVQLLDDMYRKALEIGYKNLDYHTNKYRAGFNATNENDNFKPYFALELMYELIELRKQDLFKEYNTNVVKKVTHSRYTENSFAIFPYKKRLSDLLKNQCRKSDLINWKSVIESEYKLHRHNPNPMEKSLEDDSITDVTTYKKNISRKQMMDFYEYMMADYDERKQNKANPKRAEMLRLAFKLFDREEEISLPDDPKVTLKDMGVMIDDIIGAKTGYSIGLANSIRLIPDRILNQGKEGTTLKKIGNAIGITSRAPISQEDRDAHARRAAEREERNRTHNWMGFRRAPSGPITDPNVLRSTPGTTLGGKKTKFKKVIKFKTRKRR